MLELVALKMEQLAEAAAETEQASEQPADTAKWKAAARLRIAADLGTAALEGHFENFVGR